MNSTFCHKAIFYWKPKIVVLCLWQYFRKRYFCNVLLVTKQFIQLHNTVVINKIKLRKFAFLCHTVSDKESLILDIRIYNTRISLYMYYLKSCCMSVCYLFDKQINLYKLWPQFNLMVSLQNKKSALVIYVFSCEFFFTSNLVLKFGV